MTYKKTTIRFEPMSDRQDLIQAMEARRLGLEPYMYDRDDMYWAMVTIVDEGLKAEMTYCIDAEQPIVEGNIGWTLTRQFGTSLLESPELYDSIMKKWKQSEEMAEAKRLVYNLVEAGYYDHGRAGAPNLNAGRCPHCGGLFEKGTSHPHTYLQDWNFTGEKRLIHHHKLMEKIIREKGLHKMGISGLPDIPSLEELGELEPAIIQ